MCKSLHPLTLDEVDEHLQVPDLGLQLLHQLLLDPRRVDDLSDGQVHPLPQLLGRQATHVLVQVHVQLGYQLIDDHLGRRKKRRRRKKEEEEGLATVSKRANLG